MTHFPARALNGGAALRGPGRISGGTGGVRRRWPKADEPLVPNKPAGSRSVFLPVGFLDYALDDSPIGSKRVNPSRAAAAAGRCTGQFLKGYRGGPGRQQGSRNKLGEQFIADLYADWQQHGMAALAVARKEKPADYLKVVASILPKDIKVSLETMSDGELGRRIDQLTNSLGIEIIPKSASGG